MEKIPEIQPTERSSANLINRLWFRYASFVISAGLLACFAAGFILVGGFFFPSWKGFYLAPVGFLTALDGMFAYRKLRYTGFPEKEWVLFRLSEGIVILLLLKAGYYLSHGFQALQNDIGFLVTRAWGNLFSGEFLFSVVVMLVIWMFSSRFADLLGQLEVDERLLQIEQESGIYELRSQARESLVSMVLVLGVILVLMTSLLGMQAQVDWREDAGLRSGVANLLVFFFLTLLLFSLTQLNLMSTTWIREGLTIQSNLARNWLLTSVVVILFLAIFSGVLPTRYSIGLLNLLNYMAKTITAIFSYLIFLISAPFFMVIAFLASLFKFSSAETLQQPQPELNLPPPPLETAPVPWLELLKSILFWVVLAGMVIFALAYYLHENKAILSGVKKLALTKRLRDFWRWISGHWRRINQTVQEKIQESLQGLRARFQGDSPMQVAARLNLRRISNREKVFFYYLAMLRRSSERGPERQPWQTPYEYLRMLEISNQAPASVPSPGTEATDEQPSLGDGGTADWFTDARQLTEYFMLARYTQKPVTSQESSLVKQIWERLRKALRRPGL